MENLQNAEKDCEFWYISAFVINFDEEKLWKRKDLGNFS